MAEIKNYLGIAGAQALKVNLENEMNTKDAEILKQAKEHAEGLGVQYDAAGTAQTKVEELANGQVKTNKEAIEVLNGGEEVDGSVAKQIKTANEALRKEISDSAYDDTQVKADIEAAQADVDALEAKVGTVPEDKTVVQMIADAQAAATYNDEEVRGLISDNAEAIATLNGSGEGSVDKKITDAFNDFSTKVTDDAVVNSYKELIDWAAEHGSDAAEMTAAITALEAIVDGIGGEGEKATVVAYVNDAITALKIGDYAKATELAAAIDRIAAMEAKVADWDDAVAKEHEHANKTELDKIADGDKAKWDQAVTDLGAVKADYLKAADKTELSGAIEAAQEAAEKHADDLNTAMNTRVAELEKVDHSHANQEELDKIVVGDKAKWDAAEQNAKDYADGLAKNYATAEQGALADSAVQTVATGTANGTISVDGADVAVKGLDSAAYAKTTDFDASGSAATAESNAKEHANGLNSAMDTRVAALEGVTYEEITAEAVYGWFTA